MEAKMFDKFDIIFKAGDAGECMFEIVSGRIGIYAGYGSTDEKLLTELIKGETFGEMAMIEGQPRSATAVALADETVINIVTWNELGEFFRDRPSKIVVIMQQMAKRIRELTDDYLGALNAINEMVERAEAEKKSAEAAWVKERMRRYLDAYQAINGNKGKWGQGGFNP